MNHYKFLLLIFLIVFNSCGRKESLKTGLFQLERNKVRYEYLQEQIFTKTPVDVMMFEKSFGDTTVYYEFDNSLTKLFSKSWTFKVQSNFAKQIETLFSRN